MPHLEELDWRCQKLFPPSCVATPGLRICSLDVEEPTLTDFVTFLTCTPSLTNLKLNFRGWADSKHDGSKENQVVVDLPNLEHLELVLIELPSYCEVPRDLHVLRSQGSFNRDDQPCGVS